MLFFLKSYYKIISDSHILRNWVLGLQYMNLCGVHNSDHNGGHLPCFAWDTQCELIIPTLMIKYQPFTLRIIPVWKITPMLTLQWQQNS